ncbi:Serine hydrolase [Aureococcus anophagefferens]|uniref:Serine hydrolase n=1 Tax=Aureococcus anophagefferens TaxID=44056 RepID=A0ABR1FGR5_AURAN
MSGCPSCAGSASTRRPSSWATAAGPRLCERERVKALVLVCAYHTDLGDASEAAAGYFGRPWAWDRIRENAGRVVLFHDADDPHIPKAEARLVAGELKADYHELGARAASRHASALVAGTDEEPSSASGSGLLITGLLVLLAAVAYAVVYRTTH